MTNEETQAKLEAYVGLFEGLKKRVGDEIVAMTILQEMARDARAEQIRAERRAARDLPRNTRGDEPASDKQREWLRDLGIYVPREMSRSEASSAITQALARQEAR